MNDFRIAVALGASRNGFTLLEWVDEGELRALKEKVRDPVRQGGLLPFCPDGFFALQVDDHKVSFFLEVDLATMTNSRSQRKVRAYSSARLTPRIVERSGSSRFRVLTVTTTHQRLANLKRASEKAGGDHHSGGGGA